MWDDEKGFGFIEPQGGGADVFAHITAFMDRSLQPQVGMLVSYRCTADEQNRPRASHIQLEKAAARSGSTFAPLSGARAPTTSARRYPNRNRPSTVTPWSQAKKQAGWGVGIFLAVVLAATLLGYLPASVPTLYATMSVLTFAAYFVDKSRAETGGWRIPEKTLHTLELLGGWPGALLAQQWLRHKTAKVSYQVIFWLIVMAHAVFWGWWTFGQHT